jgi:hypothetical protein|nr:MAG TPA: hypothetical protein [Caudoviricetes sp.]
MKTNSLQEMVKDYERRTGEKVSFDGFFFDEGNHYRDNHNVHFQFFPNEGFLFWGIHKDNDEECFIILQTYGNMKVIGRFIVDVMDDNGLTRILTATSRKSVNGFVKKWNMKKVPRLDYGYEDKYYRVLESSRDNLLKTL